MSRDDENRYDDCNVIYAECCFTMANRFRRLGDKYKKAGKLELASELEKEATVQMEAWLRARSAVKQVS